MSFERGNVQRGPTPVISLVDVGAGGNQATYVGKVVIVRCTVQVVEGGGATTTGGIGIFTGIGGTAAVGRVATVTATVSVLCEQPNTIPTKNNNADVDDRNAMRLTIGVHGW